MATIKEIAKACNVSVATVSNILNHKGGVGEETRQRVLQKVKELNYTPNQIAKNLKMKTTRSIGVIAEDMTVFALPEIIDGITECCEKADYQILLVNLRLYKKFADSYYQDDRCRPLVEDAIRKILGKQVEGIIYVSAHERELTMLPDDLSVPLVVAYGFTNKGISPSVVVDDGRGAHEMVSYLIAQGHKKIGVIAGKQESIHTQARLTGYRTALHGAGIAFDPKMVVYGSWDRKSGYDNTDRILERGVTAVFCMNDFMAGGVYDRLQEKHLVPGKDLAVAGYDDREMAEYEYPPLTTMKLPLYEIGTRAGGIMMNMLKKEEFHRVDRVVYERCSLVIRDSVNVIHSARS